MRERLPKKYFENDADANHLAGKTGGYGNQGRAQALNLRDSVVNVVAGSGRSDQSEALVREDGFEVHNLADSAKRADVLMLLLPDEILPQLYSEHLLAHLRGGHVALGRRKE